MDDLSVLAGRRRPWHGGANLVVGGAFCRAGVLALSAILALCGCETLLGLNDLADQTGGPPDAAAYATDAAWNVPEATQRDATDADAALWPQRYAEAAPPEGALDADAGAQAEAQVSALPDADAEPLSEADAVAEDATEDAQAPTVDGSGKGGPFCSAVPRPTSEDGLFFCDDFDVGSLPAPWNSGNEISGTLAQNRRAWVSPPNSLDIAIGALAAEQPVNVSLRASLAPPSLPATMTFAFALDPVQIDTAANAAMVLAAIDFLDEAQNRYTVQLAFDVQNGAPTTVLDELYSDGRPYVPHALPVPLTMGSFTNVAIQIDWTGAMTANAAVLMNGSQALSVPLTMNVRATSLQISIGTTYSTEPSSGWEIRYDNVLFTAM
jgi:hypothetical protein